MQHVEIGVTREREEVTALEGSSANENMSNNRLRTTPLPVPFYLDSFAKLILIYSVCYLNGRLTSLQFSWWIVGSH